MVEFLTSNLESLWSQASRPSSNWGTCCGDAMCDGMFGGYRHVAGLRDHWILGQNSFDFVSWLLRQQCRAKGYLLCPDSLYHKTGSGVHQLVAFQIY